MKRKIKEQIVIRNTDINNSKAIEANFLVFEINEMIDLIKERDNALNNGKSEVLVTLEEGSFKTKLDILNEIEASLDVYDTALKQELTGRRSIKKALSSYAKLKKSINKCNGDYELQCDSGKPKKCLVKYGAEEIWSGYKFVYDTFRKNDSKLKAELLAAAIRNGMSTEYVDYNSMIDGEQIETEKFVESLDNGYYIEKKEKINKPKQAIKVIDLNADKKLRIGKIIMDTENQSLKIHVNYEDEGVIYKSSITSLSKFGYTNKRKIITNSESSMCYISLVGRAKLNLETKKFDLEIDNVIEIVNNGTITEEREDTQNYF